MRGSSSWNLIVRRISSLAGTVAMTQASMGAGIDEDQPAQVPASIDPTIEHDLFAFVECAEDNDAAYPSAEGRLAASRLIGDETTEAPMEFLWRPRMRNTTLSLRR